ncbi:MAG: sulfatase-like hydrolase/transferase [Planctomycetota bacterium]
MRTILALAFLFLLASMSKAQQPNILWINAEDMSPHLGCYAHPDAHTPIIDAIAKQGIVYDNAFATAPICSPSRSCLATGLYATSLGTQHLRCEVEVPERVVPLAKRLRKLGYFCTNTGKSDYNFNADGVWDAWSNDVAPWRSRNEDQPFFGFITIGETHEGRINTSSKYEEAIGDLPEDLKRDPSKVTLPPFYPDTPEIRRIFAGMYDLATVFDRKVGEIFDALRADGDLENTIVFIFGDHGNGLPRYKRWLNDSGLRVPLVVYVPPKHRKLSGGIFDHKPGEDGYRRTSQLVSFVDFPSTAISLAGGNPTPPMQGIPFLGEQAKERSFVFGARSRADDMFEISRSASDGRYIYIRHFLPHHPYIQNSVIYGDRKSSLRELRRLHEAGELDEHAEKLWAPRKPREELYDLEADPHELNNLAEDEEFESIKTKLERALTVWLLGHRDCGFMPESEYQMRAAAAGQTPFDIAQSRASFDLGAALQVAWQVGSPNLDWVGIIYAFDHSDAAVRYWAAVVLQAKESWTAQEFEWLQEVLHSALQDAAPCVRIAAAEALLRIPPEEKFQVDRTVALAALARELQSDKTWVALEAASAHARLGTRVSGNVAVMKKVRSANRSTPGSPRPYKDFNYASFTGWALEAALASCGEKIEEY